MTVTIIIIKIMTTVMSTVLWVKLGSKGSSLSQVPCEKKIMITIVVIRYWSIRKGPARPGVRARVPGESEAHDLLRGWGSSHMELSGLSTGGAWALALKGLGCEGSLKISGPMVKKQPGRTAWSGARRVACSDWREL